MNTRHLIELYFYMGFTYDEIAMILSIKHNMTISVRHLKRKLHELNLIRRKGYSDLDTVLSFIEYQLTTSGQMHGYRWMYQKCLLYGLKVKKEDITLMLRMLDPQGVKLRQRRCLRRRQYFSKGPNYCWHIDSYDKLKPYGLCINGCTGGYSRKLIWLRAGRSNSDPKVIAKYCLDAVEEYGGCPTFMRGYMGTVNVRVAAMQKFL
ncbi:hypothetical protein ACJMK2_015141 [Sinanodonta woodiana]|uniref:Integrase core domain-containing protein n=1 Tax=Sinanodonta woodiana TaxID=1069815 RepID=A0ABD3V2Q3_SINWO